VAPIGPGERAVLLPGLLPDAASFAILAHADVVPRAAVHADPGLLFFLLNRHIPLSADADPRLSVDDRNAATAALSTDDVPWLNWTNPELRPVIRTALAAAHFAQLLAEHSEAVDPARAWAGGWLAYVGWLAVGVVEPNAVAGCGTDPDFTRDPFATQLRCWGMRRAEIAWRIATRWPLPRWAAVVLGRIDAAPAKVPEFGGDRSLQAVVQIAVVLAEQAETRLFVADEFDLAAALAELNLRSSDLDTVREQFAARADIDIWLKREHFDPRNSAAALPPASRPVLRTKSLPALAVDSFTEPDLSLDRERATESDRTAIIDVYAERVEAAKLSAVAEFAAGASHEINNPLAVISGQGEYLLKRETDERRRESLESIIRQTRRIHAVLHELMLFARPPEPQLEWVELGRLVRGAAAELAPFAAERRIEIQMGHQPTSLWVEADPKQMAIALAALIRNGVEAAPLGGWVRVSTAFRPERLDVIVEDNGPGPDERSRAHLFDPFYSGRSAGRGRGLGLPAAWRLARENGGEVRYAPIAGGPTRFVLTMPAAGAAHGAQRKSA
jgi:two-component system, NtrC family, sensor kinase